jgi:peptidoglycan/LPS O-acetylase OafA/YrhL
MKSINWGRVVLGGIAAGVLINISEYLLNEVVLKAQMEEAMKGLGKSLPAGGTVITVWILWSFVMGIAAVWLYAAIRPRYGAGPMTAVKAGVAVWVLAQLLLCIAFANLGIFPLNGLMLVWTLVEAIVATVAGAWVYQEEGA